MDDALFFEVKNGPTQGAHHLRMDAVAFKKSWAHPDITVYEFKTSRADFFGDNKWGGYLDYCSHFYFVTAAGLVKKTEVPDPAGLMCPASTGTMLRVVKRAKYRPIISEREALLVPMLKYIIFSQIYGGHITTRLRDRAILEKIEEGDRKNWGVSYGNIIGKRASEFNRRESDLRNERRKILEDKVLLDMVKKVIEGKPWNESIEERLRKTLLNRNINLKAADLWEKFDAMEESIKQLTDILTTKEGV